MKNKIYLLIVIILLMSANAFAQDSVFYYYKHKKIHLSNISTKLVLVKYEDGTTIEKKNQIIDEVNNHVNTVRKKSTKDKKLISKIPVGKTDANSATYAIKMDEETDKGDVELALTELKNKSEVTFAHPFFQNLDGTIQAYTNEIIVKLKEGTPYDQFSAVLNQVNAKILSQNQYRPNVFYISTTANTTKSPIELANYLYETNLFEYAEPNFWRTIKKSSVKSYETEADDPYYTSQWAHTKMKVNEAWTTSGLLGGSSNIKIAILDDGLQYEHPDLKNKLAKDATGQILGYDCAGASRGKTNGTDGHGTACAGIVAAEKNGVGVEGIAYNSQLVSVRVSNNKVFGPGYTLPDGKPDLVLNDIYIGMGIDWAAFTANADILSMSWGGDPNKTSTSELEDALRTAYIQGRNGKGCVIFAASGNSESTVSFPACLDFVIAVGATNESDKRATVVDWGKDENGKDQGSNYGDKLDLVAPGNNIYTTDLIGTAGSDPSDYNNKFGGTSAACPNAAGVAALILATNPDLYNNQVEEILAKSCDKINTLQYSYSTDYVNHPYSTWNEQVGYGRINAKEAIVQAKITTGEAPAGRLLRLISSCNDTWYGEHYGFLVRASNNYAMVAGSGCAGFYLFKNDNGSWRQIQSFSTGSWLAAGSFDICDDYIIYNATSPSPNNILYFFKRNGEVFEEQTHFALPVSGQNLILQTAISDDYAVVGSCNSSDHRTDYKVSIFRREGNNWVYLKSLDEAFYDTDRSIVISGKYILIGKGGKFGLYKCNGNDWVKLGDDITQNANRISISGDRFVAFKATSRLTPIIFKIVNDVVTQEAELSSIFIDLTKLGYVQDVQILGNMVLVSYVNWDTQLKVVLKFEKKNNVWLHTWTYRNPFQGSSCAWFGNSIALSKSFVLIGSPQELSCLGCCKSVGSVLYYDNKIEDCTIVRNFANYKPLSGDYSINAGKVIFGGDNNTAIFKPQVNYVVNAASTKLKDGFHAENGSFFKANSITCDANSLKSAKQTDNQSNTSDGNSFAGALNSVYQKDVLVYANANDAEADKTKQTSSNKFSIIPNPNHGIFKVEFTNKIPDYLEVYSVGGNLVNTIKPTTQVQEMDISKNPDGVYIIKLIFNNETMIGKMIKSE